MKLYYLMGRYCRTQEEARANAKATGTRRNMKKKKQPNRSSAAMPGVNTEPVTQALPEMIFRSLSSCSPRNASQVTPVTGHAMWMSQSGRSANSEVRFQAKRVNSMPA